MNAIIGASDQRPDECGSSEKRDCSSESTTLDRGPNTFLPAGRRLPEWLKACVREDGSYDEDLATNLAIAEFHNIDHRGINRTQHYAKEVLRKHFANDLREFHIEKILSHSGNPEKPSTLKFECQCTGVKEPLPFEFKSLRLIPKFREYLKSQDELNINSLLSRTIDNSTRKRAPKQTFSRSGMFDNSWTVEPPDIAPNRYRQIRAHQNFGNKF